MAFNFAPKTSKEIVDKKKAYSSQVALLFDVVQKVYKVGIILDPTTNFRTVKIPREVERSGILIKEVIATLKKSNIDVSKLDIKFGSGSAGEAKQTVGDAAETAKQENCSRLYFESYIEKGKYPSSESVYKIYPLVNDIWIHTFEQQSIALKKYLGSNKSYNYYRGDGIMEVVESTAKMFGVKSKDSWNPADVYIVKKDKESSITAAIMKLRKNHAGEEGLDALNAYMRTQLASKTLIGISLKRLGDTRSIAHVEETNASTTKNTKQEKFKLLSDITINLDYQGSDFTTREMSFKIGIEGETNGSVPAQVRGFPGQGERETVQTELTKFTGGARLGKVPTGVIDGFFTRYAQTRVKGSELPKVGNWTPEDIKQYVKLFDTINDQVNWGSYIRTTSQFEAFLKDAILKEEDSVKFANSFSNKLQGMHYAASMLVFKNKGVLEDFLRVLFYGAKKELSTAGPFIKIY